MVQFANDATTEWFRSAEMEYVSIGVQEHCAHRIITELGRLGVIQFTDLNPELTAFQRRYVTEIKRCDEMDRTLRYFADTLEKHEIKPLPAPDLEKFLNSLERRQLDPTSGVTRPPTATLDELQVLLEENESELISLTRYGTDFIRQRNHLLEHMHVLEKALEFNFSDDDEIQTRNATSASISSLEDGILLGGSNARAGDADRAMRFQFVTGVVNLEDRDRFERMVFRATRGNCYMRFAEIEDLELRDPETGLHVEKEVFIIFFQAAYIESKLKRICDAFGATQYQIPDLDNVSEIRQMIEQKKQDVAERVHVLSKNSSDTTNLLKEIARYLEVWRWTVKREKSVYHTLNHFMADVSGVLRAEGWVISSAREKVAAKVRKVHHDMMGDVNHTLPSWVTTLPKGSWPSQVPTYFHTNKITSTFQTIVSTYGVPRYQEANPAVFTVITFPFLFGVMFGDIGHGLCVFFAALYLVLNEKKFERQLSRGEANEIFGMVFSGRYLLVLMGFFATYAGFIYNDCFALGLKLFTPTWTLSNESGTLQKPDYDAVYPFGVDPTWHVVKNDLVFFNSIKMKMAVIFGVTQMTFGLVLKVLNAIRNRPKPGQTNLDLWFEAVPQVVFMTCLFGYMCFLIIYKWSIPWLECDRPEGFCHPPNLIQVLINLALSPGTMAPDTQMYEGQGTVQLILLLIAVAMVPLMLVPKPYYLIKRMRESHGEPLDLPPIGTNDYGAGSLAADSQGLLQEGGGGQDSRSHSTDSYGEGAMLVKKSKAGHADDEEHGVGDIVIHQAIETIEFVLGCISNTASYLRLWALSLAHSQLSSVFWEMTLLGNLMTEGVLGVILTFGGYAVFAGVTFGVLLCMDNLECFLHSLRLHWVEFQSKFFKGDGVAFTPLSFRNTLLGLEE